MASVEYTLQSEPIGPSRLGSTCCGIMIEVRPPITDDKQFETFYDAVGKALGPHRDLGIDHISNDTSRLCTRVPLLGLRALAGSEPDHTCSKTQGTGLQVVKDALKSIGGRVK